RIVEVEIQRECSEDGILDRPGRGLRTEREILPRPRTEPGESRVDPRRVTVQERAVFECRTGDHSASNAAESVQPKSLVGVEHRRTEQGRKLACSCAPQQIHLEESVLRM